MEPLNASPSFTIPIGLSVPSAGLWAMERAEEQGNGHVLYSFSTLCGPMGYGTSPARPAETTMKHFQYPLRAYGLWNLAVRRIAQVDLSLSVPSAGLWAMERAPDTVTTFSVEAFQYPCLLYTSPSPRDRTRSPMPSFA